MTDEEILKKLDHIIALLSVQGRKPEEQIRILYGQGLNSFEISKLTGIPAATIRKAKSKRLKK